MAKKTKINNSEILVDQNATYNIEFKGKHIAIENLPIRMNEETQEYYISSAGMKYIIDILLEQFAEVEFDD
ncbi:MAG: hypothetical protein AAFQ91_07390 [Cyanobacteria bacterium J06621_15]